MINGKLSFEALPFVKFNPFCSFIKFTITRWEITFNLEAKCKTQVFITLMSLTKGMESWASKCFMVNEQKLTDIFYEVDFSSHFVSLQLLIKFLFQKIEIFKAKSITYHASQMILECLVFCSQINENNLLNNVTWYARDHLLLMWVYTFIHLHKDFYLGIC